MVSIWVCQLFNPKLLHQCCPSQANPRPTPLYKHTPAKAEPDPNLTKPSNDNPPYHHYPDKLCIPLCGIFLDIN